MAMSFNKQAHRYLYVIGLINVEKEKYYKSFIYFLIATFHYTGILFLIFLIYIIRKYKKLFFFIFAFPILFYIGLFEQYNHYINQYILIQKNQ